MSTSCALALPSALRLSAKSPLRSAAIKPPRPSILSFEPDLKIFGFSFAGVSLDFSQQA